MLPHEGIDPAGRPCSRLVVVGIQRLVEGFVEVVKDHLAAILHAGAVVVVRSRLGRRASGSEIAGADYATEISGSVRG